MDPAAYLPALLPFRICCTKSQAQRGDSAKLDLCQAGQGNGWMTDGLVHRPSYLPKAAGLVPRLATAWIEYVGARPKRGQQGPHIGGNGGRVERVARSLHP
jgi:hypothetical protein